MVQTGTMLKVTDKTGVVLVQCIRVFGPTHKRIAFLGDVVLVSIKRVNVKKLAGLKAKKKKKFSKGKLSRALLVRSKVNFRRSNGVLIKFDENTVVLVNKRVVPISNRIYGPILKEFCTK